jgi:DNA modification methylase
MITAVPLTADSPGRRCSTINDTRGTGTMRAASARVFRDICGKCGARRIDQQIGLEPSPDAFVAEMVTVFQGVKRVLRDDGVCWLNLGDSYANVGGSERRTSMKSTIGRASGGTGNVQHHAPSMSFPTPPKNIPAELKPKDLIGIPWRVALALQADGWYLRSDVIWAKPNPMPESVTDRPTKSHEYVFLLTKSERYAYDADAIREPHARLWDESNGGNLGSADGTAYWQGAHQKASRGGSGPSMPHPDGRNARTVWSIPTEASPYEHFAVMPKALARKCILAGSAHGGVVLDPFAGVATTGVVALEEGRSFVGIELNQKYHAMARQRLANVAPLLATEIPA